MMDTFLQQKKTTMAMRRIVAARERALAEAREQLKAEEQLLEDLCVNIGHEFYAEDNGDYHNPGYYYICKHCNFLTCQKPSSKKAFD